MVRACIESGDLSPHSKATTSVRSAAAITLVLVLAVQLAALPQAGAAGPPAFRTDVLPVLTKAGCNSGTCHGAATGQGGFRLSLLGYDPSEDHDHITREFGARRVSAAAPTNSLLLRKASGQIEHEGGRRLRRDSAGYELLRRWIGAGAPYGPRDLAVIGIAVEPSEVWLESTNVARTLRVAASLTDGSQRDVTALALYSSNDDAIAAVTGLGEVAAVGRGLTSIMVRYAGQVAATRIAVPVGQDPVDAEEFPAANFVDDHIRAGLIRLRVPASPLSDDGEFLRRAHLDLTGRLPEPEAARAFLLGAPTAEKRRRVIDELLASDAFVDFWTTKLADLLLLNGKGSATETYHRWLREQIATNAPIDQVVRSLLTATGDMTRVGPASFHALAGDPRDLAEHVGRMFLGSQIACARCHAHPADRWTQDDYHGFAAFFARVRRDGGVIRVADLGEVDHPKTGRAVLPKPLGTFLGRPDAPDPAAGTDRRLALAAWLTAPENPSFARTMANRVWKHLTGRGLVEPVDDLRPTNPPTHPELLDALATELAAHRFDLRHLIRVIANSRTYQLASAVRGVNRLDRQLYSRAYPKPLSAPVFADAVAQVTGVPDRFEGHPAGTRAVQVISPATASTALDVLGRCQRRASCDGPVRSGGGLAQALHLINGTTINEKLHAGTVEALRHRPATEAIEELYRRALTRPPRPDELAAWHSILREAGKPAEALQDLLWTLLNSREFSLNH